jgi:peptidoglycan hydrolase-like protein with peptidoglycan-binding domain
MVPLGLTIAQTPSSNTAKKTTAAPTATKRKPVTARKTTATRSKAAPKQTWRTRQLQPTPDRYREIQQALVSRGYLTGEQTGSWNQQSVDALRHFQEDQNLDAKGKIDSLSLIALGLGPKRETAAAVPPPQPPPPSN